MGKGNARKDPTHVTPKIKLFNFGTNMKPEMGVVIYMYLKHPPDYIDSKYIWVHRFNSLGSSVFGEIPFLASLALHRERKRCGQMGTSPCYSQSEVVYAYLVLDL